MDRKLFGFFTAWQITLLLLAAILAPSSIFAAAVATQAVSITNPGTGVRAAVDVLGRLSVYDPVAGYANNPLNYVRLSGSCGVGNNFTYSLPQGKALIITRVHFYYYGGSSGGDNFVYLQKNNFNFAALETSNVSDSKTVDFGNGYYVENNETLEAGCDSGSYFFTIVGYFVASNAVPAAPTAQSMESHFVKNGRRF